MTIPELPSPAPEWWHELYRLWANDRMRSDPNPFPRFRLFRWLP